MAFLNLEDLVGNVEVVVFPRDYEQYGSLLTEEARVFIRGRANVEEEKDGKLLCEQIVSFEEARAAKGRPIFRNQYTGGGQNRNGQPSGGTYRDRPAAGDAPGSGGQMKTFPKGIWIQFPNADAYSAREQELFSAIADSDGNDNVVIYLRDTRAFKILPPNRRVKADSGTAELLGRLFGLENVKIR